MFDLKREIKLSIVKAREEMHKKERENEMQLAGLEKLAFQIKRDRSGLFLENPEYVQKLKEAEGRQVKVSVYTFKVMHKIECELKLAQNDGKYYVQLEKDVVFPLVGKCCVYNVIDAKTKDILFLNTQYLRPTNIQVAAVYGKEAGGKYVQDEIEDVKVSQMLNKKIYKERTQMLEKAEDIIKNSADIIYPQMQTKWAKYVLDSINGLYIGKDALDTIKVLKALDEGKDIKEAYKTIKDGQTGGSLSAVSDAVLEFAKGKKGAKFFKKYSNSYEFATKEKTEKLNAEVERVLARNEEYDAVCEIVDAENVGLAD